VRSHDETDSAKAPLVCVPSRKRRVAILLATALVWTFAAAACGVQGAQDEVEKARQVKK
jgi:hypothetical protein